MREIVISAREDGMRLDKFLQRYLPNAEKNFIYKMLRKKNIKLNGARCDGSEKIKACDHICIYFCDETLEKFTGKPEEIAGKPEKSAGKQDVSLKMEEKERGWRTPAKIRAKSVAEYGWQNSGMKIVYEDEDVLIVDKPAGVLSQKSALHDVSLVEYITDYLLDSGGISKAELATFHPGVCNRLDRNTSGLVIAGKSIRGLSTMSIALRDRTLHKFYVAVVCGVLEEEQVLSGWISKDEKNNKVRIYETEEEAHLCVPQHTAAGNRKGKVISAGQPAARIETGIYPVGNNGRLTVVRLDLVTGKPHQLRAHLASIGHPILGDPKYGSGTANAGAAKYGVKRQLLHSLELDFPERNLHVVAKLPDDFEKLMKGEGLWEPGILEDLGVQPLRT